MAIWLSKNFTAEVLENIFALGSAGAILFHTTFPPAHSGPALSASTSFSVTIFFGGSIPWNFHSESCLNADTLSSRWLGGKGTLVAHSHPFSIS
jgi:hypothetical protein